MKWKDCIPVGRDIAQDLRLYAVGLCLALLRSFGYFAWLSNAYQNLVQGWADTMMPFANVLGMSLGGFVFLASACLLYIPIYYQMHYGKAHSVYVMRRLPDRFSLHRRCLALPLVLALCTIAVAGVLLMMYYVVYCCVTPPEYLIDGQFALLWESWIQGKVGFLISF